jgi:hypothetical protein
MLFLRQLVKKTFGLVKVENPSSINEEDEELILEEPLFEEETIIEEDEELIIEEDEKPYYGYSLDQLYDLANKSAFNVYPNFKKSPSFELNFIKCWATDMEEFIIGAGGNITDFINKVYEEKKYLITK